MPDVLLALGFTASGATLVCCELAGRFYSSPVAGVSTRARCGLGRRNDEGLRQAMPCRTGGRLAPGLRRHGLRAREELAARLGEAGKLLAGVGIGTHDTCVSNRVRRCYGATWAECSGLRLRKFARVRTWTARTGANSPQRNTGAGLRRITRRAPLRLGLSRISLETPILRLVHGRTAALRAAAPFSGRS